MQSLLDISCFGIADFGRMSERLSSYASFKAALRRCLTEKLNPRCFFESLVESLHFLAMATPAAGIAKVLGLLNLKK